MLLEILVSALIAGLSTESVPSPRSSVSLNGEWQSAEASSIEVPPVRGSWSRCRVPGTFSGTTGVKRWVKRSIDIPAGWQGRRLSVRYDGIRWNSRHFVNGRLVGTHVEGFNPFEIDITEAIRFGQRNDLVVGVCDWQGVFDRPCDLKGQMGWDEARAVPQDTVLSPIGGLYSEFGIWADVELLAVPAIHIHDVRVITSVREHRLTVRVSLRNDGGAEVSTTVSGGVVEADGIRLSEKRVALAAGKTEIVELTTPWATPRLWTHETPHLYRLHIDLHTDGSLIDRVEKRFGFREFRCDGSWFYLNGTRLTLRSSSMWPLTADTVAQASEHFRRLRAINVICFRTHTQPWRQLWYDAADEVGMLMIPEAPIWNDDHAYRLDDDRFWGHYVAELEGMVRRMGNNPSVVAWSLENEFWGPRITDRTVSRKARLVELGRKMKSLDPTRPITYESDGDPGGVADVVGIHYPHELPDAYLYPNTCYWMDTPLKEPQWFTEGHAQWAWDRTKPLYIGEYLWCPSTTPAAYSVLCGDRAYDDYERYRRIAIGKVWSMQTRAYRIYRVSGLCPWTCADGSLNVADDPMAAAQAESMRPLAAFIKEHNARFFGGRTVRRTLHIINDTLVTGPVRVRWRLDVGGKAHSQGEMTLSMSPADIAIRTLELQPPVVDCRTEAKLVVQAGLAGAPDFNETIPCSVFPPLAIAPPEGRKIGLFGVDPVGETRLRRAGVNAALLRTLTAIPPDVGILILARNALTSVGRIATDKPILHIAARTPVEQSLDGFLDRGGRVLVLAQQGPHAGLGAIRFSPRTSTMTFGLCPSHPLLRDVESDDLKYWAPDHLVADAHVDRTACGGQSVVVSGSKKGVDLSAMASCPVGRGLVLACGMRLIEALEDEPTAGVILRNALAYMAAWQPSQERPCVLADDKQELLSDVVRWAGIDVRRVTALPDVPSGPMSVLIASRCASQTLTDFISRLERDGGLLWWHRPSCEQFEAVMKRLDRPYRLVPSNGPVVLERNHLVVDGFAQADLYWLAQPPRGQAEYVMTPLDASIVDSEIASPGHLDIAKARLIPCGTFQIVGSSMNRPVDDGIGFATNGGVIKEIDFGTGGSTVIGFRAKGWPAEDVWPRVSIRLDGRLLAYIDVSSCEISTYSRVVRIPAGRHKVELSFLNDLYAKGQDRNVWIKDLCIQPAEGVFEGLEVYSSPAALVSIPIGRGRLIIDTIRWDRPDPFNREVAERFTLGLLMKLGARPIHFPVASLEAEQMDTGGAPLIKPEGDVLAYGTDGAARTSVLCDHPGRYMLRILARGMMAANEWPLMSVRLDGRELDKIRVDSTSIRAFDVRLELDRRPHILEVAFLNDYYTGPVDDRNLYVDRIEVWTAE